MQSVAKVSSKRTTQGFYSETGLYYRRRKWLVPLDEDLYVRRPNGSYLSETVPPEPGSVTDVSRFSKS